MLKMIPKDKKCYKENCNEDASEYDDYAGHIINSCLMHKPLGWRRIR